MNQCRHFSGYKPCGKNSVCDAACSQLAHAQPRILIVHLGALGAVVRGTSILPALKRKFPYGHITWVTKKPAQGLLKNITLIDQVLTTDSADLLSLKTLHFDVGYCIDKSREAWGVVLTTQVDQMFGFGIEARTGSVVPLNSGAEELYRLGLNDHMKFHVNTKPETQLLVEALELGPFERDEYQIALSESELTEVRRRRAEWANPEERIIGINTGCSGVIPYKKLSVEGHRTLIRKMSVLPGVKIVLLGGPEDTLRNQQIAHGLKVISSPTERGLRDGMISVAACDQVITGDSLGLHLGVGLKKWVVAWFGPTCAHEIDLYGRGQFVHAQVSCSPCWKRSCNQASMCYDRVDFDEIIEGVVKGLKWQTSSFKPHSLATSSSPSLSFEE